MGSPAGQRPAARKDDQDERVWHMILLQRVSKRFPSQAPSAAALVDVSLEIELGESVAVVGRSGSGKSTLLNVMCGLASFTAGKYWFDGSPVMVSNSNARAAVALRRQIGYASQFSELLENFDVRRNVQLAATCRRLRVDDRAADAWLDAMGLAGLGDQAPAKLSGGQQQRVNIARALACEPRAVFLDEPTGSLDCATALNIMQLVRRLTEGRTLVLVTHMPDHAAACRRQLCLHEGRLLLDETGMTIGDIVDFIHRPETARRLPEGGTS